MRAAVLTCLPAAAILAVMLSPAMARPHVPEQSGPLPVATTTLGSDDCHLSTSEAAFLRLLRQNPDQGRSRLRCSAELAAFAQDRARDMAQRGYFSHVTPQRRGPNWLLKRAGYPLPSTYTGVLSNSVESIAAGYADPERVWAEFLSSPGHRAHVLAEDDFYARQDEVGVAHVSAPGSEYGDYWVVVIARRSQPGEPRYLCLPESGTCFAFGGR